MKSILLLLTAIAVSITIPSSAQKEWVKLMQDPSINFYDVQKAFKQEWKDKEAKMLKERKQKGASAENEQEEGDYIQYKRWEHFMEPRVAPTGIRFSPSAASDNYKAYLNQQSNKTRGTNQTQNVSNWTLVGPVKANCDGRVNAVAINPSRNNTIYAGSANGGLWISYDKGTNWSTNTDLLGTLGVSCIAVDPTDTSIIYIATGDADHADSYSIGVLKSFDAGQTWNSTGLNYNLTQTRRVFKVIINPSNTQILLAATGTGIWRSTNGGTSWTASVSSGNFNDIVFKPGDPTVVYAATTNVFYRSTNGGTSFSTVSGGLPTGGLNRLKIAVTRSDSSYVYVVAGNSSTSGTLGFYRSTNFGVSFSAMNTTTNTLGSQSWYSCAIAASPSNKNEVVVGGLNIYRSTNGGTSWTMIGNWVGSGGSFEHADVHDLLYTPHGDTLFTGNDGGVFVTPTASIYWKSIQAGLQIEEAYDGGISANTNKIIGGLQDNGTDLFNGTSTWTNPVGGDGMVAFIDWSSDNYMYAEYYGGDLTASHNGGSSFSQSLINTPSVNGAWVTPWLQDPIASATIYAGYENVYKSTDRGNTWTTISSNINSTVYSLAISPSNHNYIYAATSGSIFKTTNGGSTTSWTNVTGSFGGNSISYIAVCGNDPNKVWVTLSGFSAGNKVFETTNGGSTWTNVSGTLPNLPATCITFQNGTNDGVYVGMDIGVYYRDASMTDWVPFNIGLPNTQVTQLSVRYRTAELVASTFGRGFWVSPLYSFPSIIPVSNFTTNITSTCTPQAVIFTDQSAFGPTAWHWDFGDGDTSNVRNPSHTYASNGTFTVMEIVSNSNGSDTSMITVTISVPPDPVVTPASRCGDGTLNIGAAASGTIEWYDTPSATIPVGTGTSFITPILTATKTYYAENNIPSAPQYVGPADTSIGTGGVYSGSSYHCLYFDCNVPITLASVKVYASTAGNRTITLIHNGVTIDSAVVNLPVGESIVTLNFPVPAGTQFELGCAGTTSLFRTRTGGSYPYSIANIVSITGDNFGSAGYYCYFYNWQITSMCSSNRIPCTATITFGTPTISQNGNVLTSSAATTYQWYLNGNAIAGATNQTYVIPHSGTYSVAVTGNSCNVTSASTYFVAVGITEAQNSALSIYPNPVKGILQIEGLDKWHGVITVEIRNIIGEIIYLKNISSKPAKEIIDMSTIRAGIYFIQFKSSDGNFVQRIIKE